MDEYYKEFLLIYGFVVIVSLIWFGIHFHIKHKEKRGSILSANEKKWMGVSKFAGYFFLVLPLILILILPLIEKAIGIVIVLFISGVFLLELYKRKKI